MWFVVLDSSVKRAFLPSFQSSRKDNYEKRFRAWNEIISNYNIDLVVDGLWVDSGTFWDMLSVKSHPSKPAFIIQSHNFCAVPFSFPSNESISIAIKYMLCDGVVGLSENDIDYISSFAKHSKYILDPIAFDPQKISKSKYASNIILWVGRISEEKNPLDSIKMMPYVLKKVPNAKLYIVGDGNKDILNKMKQLVNHYAINENVFFEGFKLDVYHYYSLASCFISTATYEGFCLTMSEAMSYSVPIVTYDLKWLTFCKDGRGIISVPQGDYYSMAEKVVEILQNRQLMTSIGQNGYHQICEIAKANIEKDWQSFFEDVNLNRNINEQISHEAINYKYLTLFQFTGRTRKLQSLRDSFEKELWSLEERLTEENNNLTNIKQSKAFLIGEKIAFLPRKIRGGIYCLYQHGFYYTVRRTLWHLNLINQWKE